MGSIWSICAKQASSTSVAETSPPLINSAVSHKDKFCSPSAGFCCAIAISFFLITLGENEERLEILRDLGRNRAPPRRLRRLCAVGSIRQRVPASVRAQSEYSVFRH